MGIDCLILGHFRCLILGTPFKTPLRSDCVVQLQSFGVPISAHPQHDLATTCQDFHRKISKYALLIHYSLLSENKLRGVANDELDYWRRSHVNGDR